MDSQALSALEAAIAPYQRAGFVIVSQSKEAIILAYLSERFNYLLFAIFLLAFWPAAVVYLISFNNRRGKVVTLLITPQGHVEESGYTLDSLARSRRRERLSVLIAVGILAFLVLVALVFLLGSQPRMAKVTWRSRQMAYVIDSN